MYTSFVHISACTYGPMCHCEWLGCPTTDTCHSLYCCDDDRHATMQSIAPGGVCVCVGQPFLGPSISIYSGRWRNNCSFCSQSTSCTLSGSCNWLAMSYMDAIPVQPLCEGADGNLKTVVLGGWFTPPRLVDSPESGLSPLSMGCGNKTSPQNASTFPPLDEGWCIKWPHSQAVTHLTLASHRFAIAVSQTFLDVLEIRFHFGWLLFWSLISKHTKMAVCKTIRRKWIDSRSRGRRSVRSFPDFPLRSSLDALWRYWEVGFSSEVSISIVAHLLILAIFPSVFMELVQPISSILQWQAHHMPIGDIFKDQAETPLCETRVFVQIACPCNKKLYPEGWYQNLLLHNVLEVI